MGYWTAIKLFLQSWKLWLSVALAVAIALVSFQQGKESCQEKAYEALEKEIDKINEQAAKAIKQAAKDAKAVQEEREENDDIMEEARAVAGDNCVLGDAQLRVLQRIQEGTQDR